MKKEITRAADFISSHLTSYTTEHQLNEFRYTLSTQMAMKFESHWAPDAPSKGNAYRSISIQNGKADQILVSSLEQAGLMHLSSCFPENLCLWTDPGNCSYKIGDYGYVTTIYEEEEIYDSYVPAMNNYVYSNSDRSLSPTSSSNSTRSQSAQLAARNFRNAILAN